ncbi:MAG TPA: DMT family transporter [Deltaproteobacteria bacterium]|nr:DMT family transporter [Deltaproteobacteria bacterium]
MNTSIIRSDFLLLSTAIIWGFAFVAQRVGMDYVGPFIFNGVRFALGALVLLPFILKNRDSSRGIPTKSSPANTRLVTYGGITAGIALFSGASLQQMGLVYTTAGNAGFITGLYVVIVPVLGIFFRHKTNTGTWTGAFLAAAGLYLLSVTEHFTMAFGDLLVLIGAFFWAAHVLIIGWLSPRLDSFRLALIQYTACSALSIIVSLMIENTTFFSLVQACIPIFYGGVMSVGIAYTLQIMAQKNAHPAHAAIILSLEAVFAAVGGWMILDEVFTPRELLGCALMLSGMLLSQLWSFIRSRNRRIIA